MTVRSYNDYSHSDYKMTGKQFKKLRESIGYTQAKLAKELDHYIRTVSRWETGELPVPKVAELALRFIADRARNKRRH